MTTGKLLKPKSVHWSVTWDGNAGFLVWSQRDHVGEGLGVASGMTPLVRCVFISSGWDSVFNLLHLFLFFQSDI